MTAKDTKTGRTFQFRVKDQSVLQGLHVGQNVWVDFASKAVALADNVEPCCQILPPSDARASSKALPLEGARGSVAIIPPEEAKPNPADPCCDIVANSALKNGMGQLVFAFPQGSNLGSTNVGYAKTPSDAFAQTGVGNQSWQLAPGTYTIDVNKVRIPNVRVQAGHDTRVRLGVLRVKAEGSTWADVLDAKGKTLVGGYGERDVGLPVGSYQFKIAGRSQTVNVQAGKVTEVR